MSTQLTDEEIYQCLVRASRRPGFQSSVDIARAVIAAHEAKQRAEEQQGVQNGQLDFDSNPSGSEQQRQLACKVEMGQPMGEWQDASAGNTDSERAVLLIDGMDEFGPILTWFKHWTEFPLGTKLYTHPSKNAPESAPYVHKKTGRVYTIVGLGRLESTGELMVVYRGKTGTWIRPEAEFFDGRFEAIDSAKTKDTTK